MADNIAVYEGLKFPTVPYYSVANPEWLTNIIGEVFRETLEGTTKFLCSDDNIKKIEALEKRYESDIKGESICTDNIGGEKGHTAPVSVWKNQWKRKRSTVYADYLTEFQQKDESVAFDVNQVHRFVAYCRWIDAEDPKIPMNIKANKDGNRAGINPAFGNGVDWEAFNQYENHPAYSAWLGKCKAFNEWLQKKEHSSFQEGKVCDVIQRTEPETHVSAPLEVRRLAETKLDDTPAIENFSAVWSFPVLLPIILILGFLLYFFARRQGKSDRRSESVIGMRPLPLSDSERALDMV